MIGTIVFIGAFLVIGLAVVLAAMRSGRGAKSPGAGSGNGRGGGALAAAFVVGALVLGLGLPLLIINVNSDNHTKHGPGGADLTSAEANGRVLFAKNCGMCHQLSGSDAVGRVGPNLDKLNGGNVPKPLVLDAIKNGRAAGRGNMPAGLLSGTDAQDVASYVSAVAGR